MKLCARIIPGPDRKVLSPYQTKATVPFARPQSAALSRIRIVLCKQIIYINIISNYYYLPKRVFYIVCLLPYVTGLTGFRARVFNYTFVDPGHHIRVVLSFPVPLLFFLALYLLLYMYL